MRAGIRQASNPCLFLDLLKESVGDAVNSKILGFWFFLSGRRPSVPGKAKK
jgi:hypothetical protein